MSEVQLATVVLLNSGAEALLLHRIEPEQWQLPGGRVNELEVPAQAAIRHANEEFGIAVTALHKIGQSAFSQGDMMYMSEWFQITAFEGFGPALIDRTVYREARPFNLWLRNQSERFSPNVINLREALFAGHVMLQGQNLVQ